MACKLGVGESLLCQRSLIKLQTSQDVIAYVLGHVVAQEAALSYM